MKRILITGADGTVGRHLCHALHGTRHTVIASDIRTPEHVPDGIECVALDVTAPGIEQVLRDLRPDAVVHLASVLDPRDRAQAYQVDVAGTRNVVEGCLSAKVRRLVVTSSGAAYGYHHDNPPFLTETDALRGNPEFIYSDHKRAVEELLAAYRETHPELEQVVLRVCTVLGPGVENQITALFRKPRLLGLTGADSPFVFIWTDDLVKILERAATRAPAGIYNVAADHPVSLKKIAQTLNKPLVRLPAWAVRAYLAVSKPLGLSRYGPEQVRFLQYRPVLDNTKLKTRFGYIPKVTGPQAFALWQKQAGL
ncbi:UDP-glucose 4-epimerase [Roseibium hamelinense]|uniref:UDP-glucose 4-epimerase n=1 Tax=Roseibium hamelinense TaxID=150831 RepID=A0A562THR9_9HYPH|nr:SDR family oxidoreductase [Roseibium hamelinense]MTI45628.1 SDR family oxidoreductase [Roseibium hamelinense]TWI93191.1 UDP-glucose 4-epimerase [Roseibium hamelinense]